MRVHMVAICGTGMGALAGLLKEAGHEVRGSDKAFYPPMSERLAAWGIPTQVGFDASHLDPSPDLVVVGNACRKDNPEAVAALERGLRVMSFPQALAEYFIGSKTSIVVAGTHGKTTTSALLAHILTQSGLDPSYLLGGIPLHSGKSFHLGSGPHFVVEGDEYDTAFFDKRPKFIHYRAHILVLLSLEHDHADIYPTPQAYLQAFRPLVKGLPPDGLMVACSDYPDILGLARAAPCKVIFYGLGTGSGFRAADIMVRGGSSHFRLQLDGQELGPQELAAVGRHNVSNALACLAVAQAVGLDPITAGKHLASFQGVARRMQVRGEVRGVTVIDDFAHHPTKVRETVLAVRARYPERHLTAVFEPRTNSSRRKIFQTAYPDSFSGADEVLIVPAFEAENLPPDDRFDSPALAEALRQRGQSAAVLKNADAVVGWLTARPRPNSVVLIMSNGAFDGINEKLLRALASPNPCQENGPGV